jgi:hypothetical protein
MKATPMLYSEDRIFKVWEYQVSHGELLIRSQKSPATEALVERVANVDIVFVGVEYMAVPRVFRGLEIHLAMSSERRDLEALLDKPL